jgi:acetyl-CoA carboxylase biotin carboxylase subunit
VAQVTGFRRLFIANRGDVAVRVVRACDALGITPVLGVSEADRDAPYTKNREVVVLGAARASESYLDLVRVVQAAKQSRCSALHPGWGFLAENPRFAALCESHGISFIGPPPNVMQLMGSKTPAKKAMAAAGLRLIPGSDGLLRDAAEAHAVAAEIGFPVLLKAESGGGGRGMRIARDASQIPAAYEQASGEAEAAFGDGRLYLEKLLEGGRHIEIQVMGDRYGGALHLGERDCSVQRNHQKLIEETPSPVLKSDMRAAAFEAAVRATREIGYVGAGTLEFLLDEHGVLRFMEMNTRLQVEHSVTEMCSGRDLVVEQIQISAGQPLSFSQSDVKLEGCALECRINAENPEKNFRPNPGTIRHWRSPSCDSGDVRVDTHVESGYSVPPFYDSLLCKVITHAADRNAACDRMLEALSELECEGVATTIPLHLAILRSDAFRANDYTVGQLPGWPIN